MGSIRMYPNWGDKVIQSQPPGGKYETYVRLKGEELRSAAISVFSVQQRWDNEARLSEFTPPKYIASFRVDYHRRQMRLRLSNTDPGWHLVEWGAHPGGGVVEVLKYKPMTRALIMVGSRSKGR
jgi:hypothetical protein